MKKTSMYPCPICKEIMYIVGKTVSGKKIGSCGCVWKFKKTKSEKISNRRYINTEYGLEKIE